MHRQNRMMILVLIAIVSLGLGLGLAAGASAQKQGQMSAGSANVDPKNIDTFYHAITVKGMSGDAIKFDVLNTVVKNKDGSVLAKENARPIAVNYFFANDTIKYSDQGMTGSEEFMGYSRADYNAATINVAGASAVIAGKDIAVSPKDSGMEFQIGSFYVYLPDGTVKSYRLATPVKSVMGTGQGPMSIVVTPELKAAMLDAFKSGAKFPANAVPVKIKDIDAKMK